MKADPKAEAAAPAPKKKLMIIIVAAVLAIAAGSAVAAWFLTQGAGADKKEHKAAKVLPAEYAALEPFTVNLQPENGDQYLQVQLTLQVAGPEQVELIKANMAVVRNRVLLLLSSKKASEINTVAGKQQLSKDIRAAIRQPFTPKGEPQDVTDVLFTSFIIQ